MPASNRNAELVSAHRLIRNSPRTFDGLSDLAKSYCEGYHYWECFLVLLALHDLGLATSKVKRGKLHLRLAVAYRHLGRFEEALAHLDKAEELLPRTPDVRQPLAMNRGLVMRSLHRYDEAALCYRRADEATGSTGPMRWDLEANKAALLFHQGRFKEALNAYAGLLGQLETARPTTAQKQFRTRVESDTYMNMGSCHYNLGHYSRALRLFEKADLVRPATAPVNPFLLLNRAYVHAQLLNKVAAQEDLKRGIAEYAVQGKPIPSEVAELIALIATRVCSSGVTHARPQLVPKKRYKAFIGYRGSTGKHTASLIRLFIRSLGCDAFYYEETPIAGDVRTALHERLEQSEAFILVLSPGVFESAKPRDVLYEELRLARKLKLPIIAMAEEAYNRSHEAGFLPRHLKWVASLNFHRLKLAHTMLWQTPLLTHLSELT